MRAYIAGPMRGLPNFNYDAFGKVAAKLRSLGWDAINPAENFGGDQSLEIETYMTVGLRQLLGCDCIVLLPGWEESEGARLEAEVARMTGIRFFKALCYPSGCAVIPAIHPEAGNPGGARAAHAACSYGDGCTCQHSTDIDALRLQAA